MEDGRYDVVVVGAGPAGSVAALVLARAGARVALVDRAGFPRDKACGDLVGPRGVQVLADLGVTPAGGRAVGDMDVYGPSGRVARLPARPGRTYPGHALALPRAVLDAHLRDAALAAGAEPRTGRVTGLHREGDGRLAGLVLDGRRVAAGTVIGADGAVTTVGQAAGLVDPRAVLWGFAVRAYLPEVVDRPVIALWDEAPGRGFPGYGWLFPGVDGTANAGLGLGMGADRRAAARAAAQLHAFAAHLRRLGLLAGDPADARRLGGWLKMGLAGTVPARAGVLLVGDAAGLVNPLQGEGIAQALASGRAAAEAVATEPSRAAARYRAWLAATQAPYARVTAPVHATLLRHPRAVSAMGRTLTLPTLRRALAGGWALSWNDLRAGARPGPARVVADVAHGVGWVATAPARTRRRIAADLAG